MMLSPVNGLAGRSSINDWQQRESPLALSYNSATKIYRIESSDTLMTKVSIITACYNSHQTISDTLVSINKQTYSNIEHVIIDGASSDDTLKIVREKGQRVAKIISEPDGGIYDAYNKGLKNTTGDIIGMLNSDDYYSSVDVIERVVQVFRDPEVQACHADLVYVAQNDTGKIVRHWKSRELTKQAFCRGVVPAHPTVFFRKSVYDEIGDFDLSFRLAADYEFLTRAFYAHSIKSKYCPEIWVRMRAGGATGGSMSSIAEQNREIRLAQNKHGNRCSNFNFYATKVIDRILQRVRAPFVGAQDVMR